MIHQQRLCVCVCVCVCVCNAPNLGCVVTLSSTDIIEKRPTIIEKRPTMNLGCVVTL
jgi:hypothetical protein